MRTPVPSPALRIPATRRAASAVVSGAAALGACAVTAVAVAGARAPAQRMGLAVFGVGLVGAGLLAQVWPARRVAGWQQVVAAFAAVLLAATITAAEDATPLGLALVLGLLWGVHPDRAALPRWPAQPSAPLAVAAAGLAVPLAPLVVSAVRDGAAAPVAQPLGMLAAVLGLPLCALAAAGRAPGWRLCAWSAGGGAIAFGAVAAAATPPLPAFGRAGGVVLVVAGIGVLLAARHADATVGAEVGTGLPDGPAAPG